METLWRVLCGITRDSYNEGATDNLKIFLKLSEIQNLQITMCTRLDKRALVG